MFFKGSRYRKLEDELTTDARGRTLPSKSIRLLPAVEGQFQHVVAAGERLDLLAYKYYQQPRKWWRICDANAPFLSPLALLGDAPCSTLRCTVRWREADPPPPWAILLGALAALIGVEDVLLEDEVQLQPKTIISGGQSYLIQDEQHQYVIVVTYNTLNVALPDLVGAIKAQGYDVKTAAIGRAGKTIVIPPDTAGA